MNRLAALAISAGLVLGSAAAAAGEIVDAATKAESLAAEGKHLEALDAMSAGVDLLWTQTPLTVRKALFVSEPPSGFGVYKAKEGEAFKPGETIFIYAEPVGYGYRQDGEAYEVSLVADVALRIARGTLGAQKGFETFGFKSLVKKREFFLPITYDFGSLDPGKYTVETTLTDSVTGNKAKFELPFTIQ